MASIFLSTCAHFAHRSVLNFKAGIEWIQSMCAGIVILFLHVPAYRGTHKKRRMDLCVYVLRCANTEECGSVEMRQKCNYEEMKITIQTFAHSHQRDEKKYVHSRCARFFGLCASSQSNCAYSGWQVKTVPWEINWYLFFFRCLSWFGFSFVYSIPKAMTEPHNFIHTFLPLSLFQLIFVVLVFFSVLGHCCWRSPRKFKFQQKALL